ELIKVIGHETPAMVEYDFEQAYEVSQVYRKQFFSQAASQGYVGLEACQVYVKEQTLEYKMQS
ncbi:MAG: hypothetical protein EBU52_05600, partial [Cytophagia bacterium]|nr:hypothetical protein [Cytophagia bacterium]